MPVIRAADRVTKQGAAATFTGTDTFTYSVRSGGAVTAPGTVTVVVK